MDDPFQGFQGFLRRQPMPPGPLDTAFSSAPPDPPMFRQFAMPESPGRREEASASWRPDPRFFMGPMPQNPYEGLGDNPLIRLLGGR